MNEHIDNKKFLRLECALRLMSAVVDCTEYKHNKDVHQLLDMAWMLINSYIQEEK